MFECDETALQHMKYYSSEIVPFPRTWFDDKHRYPHNRLDKVYYESRKRELKTKLIYENRCDERLKN